MQPVSCSKLFVLTLATGYCLSQRLIVDFKKENADLGTKEKVFLLLKVGSLIFFCNHVQVCFVWTVSGHCRSLSTKSHTEWEASRSNHTTRPHEVQECSETMTVRSECDLGVFWQLKFSTLQTVTLKPTCPDCRVWKVPLHTGFLWAKGHL